MSPGSVRILGGELRGRALRVAPGVRPSEGRVREALFSIWQARLRGARFLDLFAGSGAVGLEALGRGAAAVVLVEHDRRAVARLRDNCKVLEVEGWRIHDGRLPGALGDPFFSAAAPFDLVFADPPYAFDAYAKLLGAAAPRVAPDGQLALELSARIEPPPEAGELALVDLRRYGESALAFYDRRPHGVG